MGKETVEEIDNTHTLFAYCLLGKKERQEETQKEKARGECTVCAL